MLRLSVCELSTYRWTFEEDVLHYRAAGFDAIGIWRAKLADYGEDKAVELLREHNMSISSLSWIGGFTGSDGRSYRDSLHDGLDTIQLAADIQAECVVVLAGGRCGHTSNHAQRLLRAALKELAEAAEAVGVQLALEPMHVGCAFEWTFLNSVPQCLDIIASINRDNLGIVFDCYHLAQDLDALAWIDSIVPFVRLVQLGDAKHAPMGEQNRCLLGHGMIPLPEIMQAFCRGGYSGYFELEAVGEELEHYTYEHVLRQGRQAALEWATTE
ncbi:MAG: sugar phosphate isomerase/epimerase family protein [Pirellulales bacterium]